MESMAQRRAAQAKQLKAEKAQNTLARRIQGGLHTLCVLDSCFAPDATCEGSWLAEQ